MNDHHVTGVDPGNDLFDASLDAVPQPSTLPPPPPMPQSPPPAEERIERALAQIRDQLAAGNDRAAAREQIIDRLHAENQRLRSGELQLLLRPILTDLQRLRNELLGGAGDRPLSPEQVAALLASYASSVELTLERGGIRVVRPRSGIPFDPAAHRVVGVVPTGDSALDGTVADVTADGYVDAVSGRTALPASVLVHRFTPTEPEPPSPEIATG